MPPPGRVSEADFPIAVQAILQARCTSCHTFGERDPAGWGSATDLSRMIAADIVVPGSPDTSRLWNRVAVRADMPFNGARLSGTEIATIRDWITNMGRPFSKPRTNEEILDLIVADQGQDTGGNGNRGIRGNNNADVRYISFSNFVDEHRSDAEISAAGAVLGMALNSLSSRQQLVKLVPIDAQKTIFRFNLNDVGWSQRDWDNLASFYPYCLRSNQVAHRNLYNRLNTEAPVVRGDWFLATALKPPLYNDLLNISDNLDQIADDLGVDINRDINHPGRQRPSIQRIGFRSSGVSLHNRVFERHQTRGNGYFWVSYDFDSDLDRSDIRANPLGPANRDEQGFQHTFENVAGEMIWSLPNGMQAYTLANAAAARLDEADKSIVRDPRQQNGAVTTGISCFGCHGVTGMNKPRVFDEVTKYVADHRRDFQNREIQEITDLYVTNGEQLLATDAGKYLTAMVAAGGQRVDPGVIEYDDFINLTGEYAAKVGLRAAAVELGADIATIRNEVNGRGRNEDALPLSLSDPLVTRDDFVCRFRRIVRDVRRVDFCQGTFNDQTVQNFCDNR
jgi:mono/diheme cytochrome c family protein